MLGIRLFLSLYLLTLVFDVSLVPCNASRAYKPCNASSCGNIHNISYPFRLTSDPHHCGHPFFELFCENNNRATINFSSQKYYVEALSYQNEEIRVRVLDPGLDKDNCSSMPQSEMIYNLYASKLNYFCNIYSGPYSFKMIFLSCPRPINNSSIFIDTSPCINDSFSSKNSYVLVGNSSALEKIPNSCTINTIIPSSPWLKEERNHSFDEIRHELLMGIELYCYPYDSWCPKSFKSFHCIILYILYYGILPSIYGAMLLALIIGARALCGFPCFLVLFIYTFRRRHLSMDVTIEEFLQGENNLIPIRYSYWEIKRMTKGFKDKLGQGGFGSVFKGKLRSGSFVAIKILKNSKTNGQDFINEVGTIGRIHHVNVVQLIGYCSEGSKQALVYEFMPNGSLEKYIFPHEEIIFLSWEKMYEIALGVARGIEYIHRGCDIQILHFDIKPQNILLDEDFTPKISDFGLAKFFPTDDSIVSLTAARGTIGYIAPELFYKNIGGISNKADVYSFGMLLMEMVGRRKNVNPKVEHSSQIYFPTWIYDRLNNQAEDMEIGDCSSENDRELAKKMIIVALWCIQMKPIDRPPMTKIVEMLEGPIQVLQMPPKPFLSSPERVVIEDRESYPSSLTSSTIFEITSIFS